MKQLIGLFVHDESIRIYNIHLCLKLQSCLLNLIVAFSEPRLRCLNTPTSCFWPRGDDYQQFTVREFPRDPERTTSRNTEHMRALRKQNNQTRRVAPTHRLFNSFSTAAVLRSKTRVRGSPQGQTWDLQESRGLKVPEESGPQWVKSWCWMDDVLSVPRTRTQNWNRGLLENT